MNLNFVTPVNNLGFGLTGLNFLNSLSKLGVNIALFPIGPLEVTDISYKDVVQTSLNNQGNFDNNAPSLRLFHPFSLAEHIGKGKKNWIYNGRA